MQPEKERVTSVPATRIALDQESGPKDTATVWTSAQHSTNLVEMLHIQGNKIVRLRTIYDTQTYGEKGTHSSARREGVRHA